jgi:iron complex outermembrane receptor protein
MLGPRGASDMRDHLAAGVISIAVRRVIQGCRHAAFLASATVFALDARALLAQEAVKSAQEVETASPSLEEVIVTAERRHESIENIPYNISAYDQEQIQQSGAVTLDDLTRLVPGLSTVDAGPAERGRTDNLTIRGLSTQDPGGGKSGGGTPGQTVSTVSTYFGETPIFFPMVLDDIESVEVLRGPQGTLYGSGAEAGTIRVIPRRPDFSGFDAAATVTGSGTEHAEQLNGGISGMLNLKITDDLAARFVAGTRHLAGFIDAVNLWELGPNGIPLPSVPGDLTSGPKIGPEKRGVNSSDQSYGRAALRWKPAESVDLEFAYLHQKTTQADNQASNPYYSGGLVDLTATNTITNQGGAYPHSSFIANGGGAYVTTEYMEEPYTDTTDLGSVVATVDFGLATFTSATSYYDDSSETTDDNTYDYFLVGGPNYINFFPYLNYPRFLAVTDMPASANTFVQELRLVSNGQNHVDYVVGAYYQHEQDHAQVFQNIPGIQNYLTYSGQPNPSTLGDLLWDYDRHTSFTDRALFGELTGHITQAWQVTAGVRFFRQTYGSSWTSQLPLCGSVCSANLTDPTGLSVGSNETDFNNHIKKFNTSYNYTPNNMVYATYSEGFRRGGTNPLPLNGPFATLPTYQTFAPDFARNYEVGFKGTLLERRLRYDADAYLIDFRDFQFNTININGYPAVYNGSYARSKGVELQLESAVTDSLNSSIGYAYTDARNTQELQRYDLASYALIPSFGGTGQLYQLFNLPAGARLAGVPERSATFAVDYAVLHKRVLLHVDGAYRSWAPGDINVTSPFYWAEPSSFITNARATLRLDQNMSCDLFVNNITSETAYSGAANVQSIINPYSFRDVTRPRTIGITLRYKH